MIEQQLPRQQIEQPKPKSITQSASLVDLGKDTNGKKIAPDPDYANIHFGASEAEPLARFFPGACPPSRDLLCSGCKIEDGAIDIHRQSPTGYPRVRAPKRVFFMVCLD